MASDREINGQRTPPLARAWWIILTFAFLAAVLLDALLSEKGFLQLQNEEEEYRLLLTRIEELELEIEMMERRIRELQTDPAAVEKVAREELGFAKPGEEIYIFPAQPPVEPQSEGQTSDPAQVR